MYKPENERQNPGARPVRAECCTDSDCASGLRNKYFVGKRLTPDAFRVEQRYLIERRHLLNRAVFGWGVVYGFPIKPTPPAKYERQFATGRLQIGPGLALDQAGRELVQTGTVDLQFSDMIPLDDKGAIIKLGRDAGKACWLLSVHYAEQDRGPLTVSDPCSCDRHECDQVCESVRYSLRQIDCSKCCAEPECGLQCGCGSSPCCGKPAAGGIVVQPPAGPPERPPVSEINTLDPAGLIGRPSGVIEGSILEAPQQVSRSPVMRGGCRCLCDHLTNLDPSPDCEGLREIDGPCGRVRVDLRHGVPLACVRLDRDECSDWMFVALDIEACGPRRLVKRNDVLFDLIRGCDLTRIRKIGWDHLHRQEKPVPFKAFAGSFGVKQSNGTYAASQYWVEFSRPVRERTVRADCFSMTVTVPEDEGGWQEVKRVPILGVVLSGGMDVPKDHVTRAELVIDGGWVRDELRESTKTIFNHQEVSVEIEIRGDYIVDCNGQTVDANAVGLSPYPTGNGTPGGTFVSTFSVAARGSSNVPYEDEHHAKGVES
jgi:hypothetical protein